MISSLSSYHFHNLPHNYPCWTLNTILTDNGTKCCYCMEYILSPHIKGMQHHKLGYLVTTIQSKLFTLESKWMKSLGIVQYTTCTHIQGNSDREKKKKEYQRARTRADLQFSLALLSESWLLPGSASQGSISPGWYYAVPVHNFLRTFYLLQRK